MSSPGEREAKLQRQVQAKLADWRTGGPDERLIYAVQTFMFKPGLHFSKPVVDEIREVLLHLLECAEAGHLHASIQRPITAGEARKLLGRLLLPHRVSPGRPRGGTAVTAAAEIMRLRRGRRSFADAWGDESIVMAIRDGLSDAGFPRDKVEKALANPDSVARALRRRSGGR